MEAFEDYLQALVPELLEQDLLSGLWFLSMKLLSTRCIIDS